MPTPLRILSGVTLAYVRIGFVYLVAGPILLLSSVTGLLTVNRDAFFVMELYGFVTMVVFEQFKQPVQFQSPWAHFFTRIMTALYGKIASILVARIQLVTINLGTIALTLALSGDFTPGQTFPLMVGGIALILASALMHTANLSITIRSGLKAHDSKVKQA